MKPQHSAALLIVIIFGFAIAAALMEQADLRKAKANLRLCPLCEQEVRP